MKANTLTLTQALTIAAKHWSHARGCDKHIGECGTCDSAIAWFGSLPLPTLAHVLADRPKVHSSQ